MSESSHPAETAPKKKVKRSQERVMLMLTVIFFIGILLYTFLPEGAVRVSAMTVYTMATTWALFKYGL